MASRLDVTLKYLYNPKSEFIICEEINIQYVNESDQKKTNSLLKTHNLSHTVNFATRIQNCLSTAIDDIFRDSARLGSSWIPPTANSLSDHNAQFLTANNITTKVQNKSKNKISKVCTSLISHPLTLCNHYSQEPSLSS
jgi:hypothetical protein